MANKNVREILKRLLATDEEINVEDKYEDIDEKIKTEQLKEAKEENEALKSGNVRQVLNSIVDTDEQVNVESKFNSIEEQLKNEKLKEAKLKNEALEGENKGENQDRKQRKKFAEKIFTFVTYYMFAVFFILILCGSPSSFHLSDTVLVTLLGTTTANVIGILIIVVTYLFSKKNKGVQ